jgi:hypothetical protein
MENIFYAALALHIAGKPVNKENIQAVLEAAGTSVDGPALDAMAAFVESLEAAHRENKRPIDPRIVKFLTSELAQRKVQTGRLEVLLEELTKSIPSASETHEAILWGMRTPRVEDPEPRLLTLDSLPRTPTQDGGRYIYGIVAGGKEVRLGQIGIEGNEVYTIPYQDLCAIVHNCPAEPYQSKDAEIVKGWVGTHQSVLDEAKERFGTIIPFGFDVILQPKDDAASPDQVVRDWLEEDYDRLHTVMEEIRGKDEYGVQVLYEPDVLGKQISEQSEEIRKIKEEMAAKSPGLAYMYKQRLEKAVKAEMERLADERFKDFYGRIKQHTDDIVVEKARKLDKDRVMLLNLSCLVAGEKVDSLGEELEKINNKEGFSVRFTGPWPPYSFVAKPVVLVEED